MKKQLRVVCQLVIYFLLAIALETLIPQYVVERTVVNGDSMLNNFESGDNLIVEKVSYHVRDPKRFDVIVFYPYGKGVKDYYIKRVIGLPGETIQIKGSDVLVDGEVLKEDFGKDPIDYSGIAEKPLKLGKDEFFVLGDNRKISEDSRYQEVGLVKKKNIAGRVVLRIYPFSKFGLIKG